MTPGIRPWIFAVALLGLAVQAADTPLAVTRRELPPAQNAYVLWAKAIPALTLPDDTPKKDIKLQLIYTPPDENSLKAAFDRAYDLKEKMPEGEGRQRLDAWLASIKEPLALVSQGIELGRLQFPPISGFKNLQTTSLSGMRHIARIKLILAREHVERAEYADAARELTDIIRMSQLIAAGDGTVIHYLTGSALEGVGLAEVRWCCANPDMPLSVLRQLLSALPAPNLQDPALAQAHRVDYAQVAVPCFSLVEGEATSPVKELPISIDHMFDKNESLRLTEKVYIRLIANAQSTWPDRDRQIENDAKKLVPPMEGIPDPANFFWDMGIGAIGRNDAATKARWQHLELAGRKCPNILGKILVMQFAVSEVVLKRSIKARTETNLTRAILALRIIQKETGRWPASLEACRALLPEPPLDLFAKPGTWVRYSPDRAILWSVGPDEVDNNGDPAKDVVLPRPKLAPAPSALSQRIEGT